MTKLYAEDKLPQQTAHEGVKEHREKIEPWKRIEIHDGSGSPSNRLDVDEILSRAGVEKYLGRK